MSWAYTGNWTRVMGSTVIDTPVRAQSLLRGSAAAPAAAQVQAHRSSGCRATWTTSARPAQQLHDAGQSTSTATRRSSADGRRRRRQHELPGRRAPSRASRAPTRCAAASTCAWRSPNSVHHRRATCRPPTPSTTPTRARRIPRRTSRRANIGLSLAALMLGLPTTVDHRARTRRS